MSRTPPLVGRIEIIGGTGTKVYEVRGATRAKLELYRVSVGSRPFRVATIYDADSGKPRWHCHQPHWISDAEKPILLSRAIEAWDMAAENGDS